MNLTNHTLSARPNLDALEMFQQADMEAARIEATLIEPDTDPLSDGESIARHRFRRCNRLGMGLLAAALETLLVLLAGEPYIRNFDPEVLYPRYLTDGEFGIRVNMPNARD